MVVKRSFELVALAMLPALACYSGDGRDAIDGDEAGGASSHATDSTNATEGAGDTEQEPEPEPEPLCPNETTKSSLDFLGSTNVGRVGDGVDMGPAPELGLPIFTLEAWIRWDGYGTRAGSGSGGVSAEPIVGKGRGEGDGDVIDCNYFFGIDAEGRLAADFEDMESGANHPITGTGVIEIGRWTHVAATFDGTKWSLYIDGELDASTEVAPGAVPRFDSIQHFGIGAAYDSQGEPAGGFDGRIDDVRVWARALEAAELQAGMTGEPPSTDGLVAHWPLDEVDGPVVPDLISGLDGERHGAIWVADGRPVGLSTPPAVPTPVAPLEAAGAGNVELAVTVTDDNLDEELHVQFWGRQLVEVEPFTVIALPDTQYYVADVKPASRGGIPQMFYAQTQWIRDNAEYLNIRGVLHLGDLVHNNHAHIIEWNRAEIAMSTLEETLPGFPEGIPYGIAIGNHDQAVNTAPGETLIYNQYFGVDRFLGRSYYGGAHGDRNDDSYIVFSAGNVKILAFFFEFDAPNNPEGNPGPRPGPLAWARRVMRAHPDHVVMTATHQCLVNTENNPKIGTPFAAQGRIRHEAFRGEPNLRFHLCGHTTGEDGRRTDVAASTVHSLLSNYQFDGDGGSGRLRIMTFHPERNEVEVETYSPHYDRSYPGEHTTFVLPVDLDYGAGAFELIGSVDRLRSGETAAIEWPDLPANATFEWYATVTDCTHTTTSERNIFSTNAP